jgi:hypothetical protein
MRVTADTVDHNLIPVTVHDDDVIKDPMIAIVGNAAAGR